MTPCKECISYAICRLKVIDTPQEAGGLTLGLYGLVDSCSILRNYAENIKIFCDMKTGETYKFREIDEDVLKETMKVMK